jgi:putative aminopeptidase FrvX
MPLPPIDFDYLRAVLNDLLAIPSPVGKTEVATQYCLEILGAMQPQNLQVSRKGVLSVTFEGNAADEPRGITAHLDTLGGVVKSVNPNGRLHLCQLGNYSWNSIENESVSVFAQNGEIYRGSVITMNSSHHLHQGENGNGETSRNANTMEIRLDACANSSEEVEELGIQVGDYIVFDPRTEWNWGYVRSRFLDDKALVACLLAALKAIHQAGITLSQRTTVILTNYEEQEHGGASGWPDDLYELLALDVSPVGEGQASKESCCTLCVADADGPYDYKFGQKLRELAKRYEIKLIPDVFPKYASDAGAARRAGLDAHFALIGPGVDATHGIERTHTEALEATARMIAAYLIN